MGQPTSRSNSLRVCAQCRASGLSGPPMQMKPRLPGGSLSKRGTVRPRSSSAARTFPPSIGRATLRPRGCGGVRTSFPARRSTQPISSLSPRGPKYASPLRRRMRSRHRGSAPASCPCRASTFSKGRTRHTAMWCCRPLCRDASRSKPPRRRGGTGGWATRARWSGSPISALRRLQGCSWRSMGLPWAPLSKGQSAFWAASGGNTRTCTLP